MPGLPKPLICIVQLRRGLPDFLELRSDTVLEVICERIMIRLSVLAQQELSSLHASSSRPNKRHGLSRSDIQKVQVSGPPFDPQHIAEDLISRWEDFDLPF